MGHTKPSDLKDLAKELADIRKLEGLKEKSPGIFYYKSTGFLHFHDKDGKRWADVKTRSGWTTLAIDFDASLKEKQAFISEVKRAYERFVIT